MNKQQSVSTDALTASNKQTTLALVLISAVAPAVLTMAPVVAGQLAAELQMGPAFIGTLFTFELGAMSLASLPACYWLSRFNWRIAGTIAAVLFILANLGSVVASSASELIPLRIVSGLGGGSVMILCMGAASTLPQPDRIYGLWVMGQLALGALGLALLPNLFAHFGLSAFFALLAVLMLFCLPLLKYLPTRKQPGTDSTATPLSSGLPLPALIGLLAVLLFCVSLNGVWTFMGAIADSINIDAQVSGNVLAVASLLGIAGALSATVLGGRQSYRIPLLAGYAIMIVGILLLTGSPDEFRFTIAALGFKYAWTFAFPFILASLASIDRNGQLMGMANLVIGGGLALGPLIAGRMVEQLDGFQAVLLGSAVLAFFSLPLILLLQTNRAPVYGEPKHV
ncbi:MFS transporter [Marinobacter sp. GN3S48]|uniref:MFS transporter n=1 Tax=Marinobacter sp. GN3S48 TaxID=3382302 RepID=UPI00387B14B7